jgi:hypothetical protein
MLWKAHHREFFSAGFSGGEELALMDGGRNCCGKQATNIENWNNNEEENKL